MNCKFSLLVVSVLTFLTCSCAFARNDGNKAAAGVPAGKAAAGKNTAPAPAPAAKKTPFRFPALENPASWTMVIVPDTQTYVKQIENHGILDMMYAWIVRRRDELNIRQVLFTGDLVYRNDSGVVDQPRGIRFYRNGRLNDLVGEEQWKAFSRLTERLDGQVPYILSTGNHDHGMYSAENRKSRFGKYFPTDRNPLTRGQLVECGVNAFGDKTLENAAYEFTAPYPDGRKFLVISLQFAPTDGNLKWAKRIADSPRFAKHFGIVVTHSYMRANGERIASEKYNLNRAGGNAGEGIYQKLVYPSKNIRLVVCGHVCSPDRWDMSVGFSMDKNSSGKSVAQMVFNTQAIGGGFSGNGGDGWLRLLEFMPDRKTIKARTFSPFFGGSPSTLHLAWMRDSRNEFSFVLE